MSDFDREAERERLREKYERDQEKRESTQRMSELLLQGATMTNRHCEECGDPIFSYEEREFCPTCQEAVEDGAVEAESTTEADVEAAAGANAATDGDAAVAEGSVTVEPAAEGTASETDATPQRGERGEQDRPVRPARGSERAESGPAADDAAESTIPHEPPEGASQTADADESAAGGRATARAALERTVTRFAERAERADDPREARDLLAAAREAAEALAALDGRPRQD